MKKYETLLIIEDEVEIGESLVEIFEPMFNKVIYCDNAIEALGVTKAAELSIILTDFSMTGMNGEQFIQSLRIAGNFTPVVFLTAYASKDFAISAMRLGVADVFEKPFDPKKIVEDLDRVLEIEKRKSKLHEKQYQDENTVEEIKRDKKILGLLHVANKSKKVS